MWFKKKKKKEIIKINSLYHVGQYVHFRYRDELYFGYVFAIYKNINNEVIYDIQVGGQCPAIIRGIKEDIIFIVDDKK